jgi:two-component system OmpR family sensor kinase
VRSDRLTRQELTWLLTQEARTAAAKLREGVAVLSTANVQAHASPRPLSIEPELDALDDAMKMLASLHSGAPARSRRGRIDLAALVWEVAPGARVSIEPGSGTEVFGDETELRRMLQVLLGSSSPTGSGTDAGAHEVSIRRAGGEVSVSVALGPDSSAHAGTERAWLARMATRYGGRLHLDGGTESIRLPADGADDQREVESLKRELLAAQRLALSSLPPQPGVALEWLTLVVSSFVSQLSPVFAAIEREVSGGRDLGVIGEQIAAGSEIVSDLARLGRCSSRDTVHPIDAASVCRSVVHALSPRAARRGVTVSLSSAGPREIDASASHLALLVRTLVIDGILATPRGGAVRVTLRTEHAAAPGVRATISIEDGGPPVGKEGFLGIVAGRFDPSNLGRPSTIALVTANAIAQHIGATVAPADAPFGRMDIGLGGARQAG